MGSGAEKKYVCARAYVLPPLPAALVCRGISACFVVTDSAGHDMCEARSERIGADGSMKQRRRKPGKPGYWTARSKKLGRRERVFDEDEAFIFLKAAIEREGSLIAFSENYGVDKTYVSHALHGRFPIAGAIIKALGFRKVYIATKKNRR